LNIPEEDRRIKKLTIDEVRFEQLSNESKLDKAPRGGNSSLNVKKLMLELRREKINEL